ncbi:MAG: fructosamine kinase family protein [Phycisphaerales bacterium]
MQGVAERISNAINEQVASVHDLNGGCIARVVGCQGERSGPLVAKIGDSSGDLRIEASMLVDLARLTSLPVPHVLHSASDLLVLQRLPGSPGASETAQSHLAELLADLHGIESPSFGYERDTLIGPLSQPNRSVETWAAFFAHQRVVHFATLAEQRRALPPGGLRTAHRLAEAMERAPWAFVAPDERPVLIHGDLWSGNFLSDGQRITGIIAPAIYYADRESELAFMSRFGGVGRAFYDRYHELRPIAEGFFEHRREMYQIYPLLVHAVLFGGGYGQRAVAAMERALSRAPR